MKTRITYILAVMTVFMWAMPGFGQTNSEKAKTLLDKVAKNVNRSGGATANFTLSSDMSSSEGTIAIKGNKFHATTARGIVWYNGKTQWTYMKANEEVNISNPNASQKAQMNPYYFITLYKKGYDLKLKNHSAGWEVHMTATNANNSLPELYIIISKDYLPQQVKYRQKKKWTTIKVSNFKAAKLSDDYFTFHAKDYPSAEVIDLR